MDLGEEKEKSVPEESSKLEEDLHPESPVTEKIRKNPWILSTIVLGILAIILLAGVFESDGMQEQRVNLQNVGDKVEAFYEHYGMSGVAVSDVKVAEKDNYFYRVDVMYKGQEIPFYVTKSGHMAGNSLTSIIPNQNGGYDVPGMENFAVGSSEQEVDTNGTQSYMSAA